MPTVQTVLHALERLAPARTAFEWDRIGLQVGDAAAEVRAAVVALDPSPGLLEFARDKDAQLLLCHHPVIWEPLKSVTMANRAGRLVREMVAGGYCFIAAHTNWDAAPVGINGRLAELLGIQNTVPIGSGQSVSYAKIVVMTPSAAVDPLIDAMAEAGAGTIGLYARCAFQSDGMGSFVGGEGASPKVGQAGRREEVQEIRLEMRAPQVRIEAVADAIRRVHPYEEPAFDVYPLHPELERPMGRLGTLADPISLAQFARFVDQRLEARAWTFGDPAKSVQRVAICGGGADDEWRAALAAGADVFVTGEVKHHNAVEAAETGLAILAAGHFATEHPGCEALAEAMAREVPDVDWKVFVPQFGFAGRPVHGNRVSNG